jgi:hypothetical protein
MSTSFGCNELLKQPHETTASPGHGTSCGQGLGGDSGLYLTRKKQLLSAYTRARNKLEEFQEGMKLLSEREITDGILHKEQQLQETVDKAQFELDTLTADHAKSRQKAVSEKAVSEAGDKRTVISAQRGGQKTPSIKAPTVIQAEKVAAQAGPTVEKPSVARSVLNFMGGLFGAGSRKEAAHVHKTVLSPIQEHPMPSLDDDPYECEEEDMPEQRTPPPGPVARHASVMTPQKLGSVRFPQLSTSGSLAGHLRQFERGLLDYKAAYLGRDQFIHFYEGNEMTATMLLVDSLRAQKEVHCFAERLASRSDWDFHKVVREVRSRFCDPDRMREMYEMSLKNLHFKGYAEVGDFLLAADDVMDRCVVVFGQDSASEIRSLTKFLLQRLPLELQREVQKDLQKMTGTFDGGHCRQWDSVEWETLRSIIKGHSKVFERVDQSLEHVSYVRDGKDFKSKPVFKSKPKNAKFTESPSAWAQKRFALGLAVVCVYGAGILALTASELLGSAVEYQMRTSKSGTSQYYLAAYKDLAVAQAELDKFKAKGVLWDKFKVGKTTDKSTQGKANGKLE